jgi:dihydrofolate synthase/folylpolyglutamate synthase
MSENAFINESQHAFNRAKKHLPDATFFELITAIAFEYFARNKVDVLICEVGLGGRLDSTNVTSPTVSVLTSVGLDHTEWLGKDEKSIAHEKAYISRRNRTLLLGSMSAEAHEGVSAATRVTGAFTRYIGNCEQNADNSIALAQATIEEVSSSTGLAVHPSQVMESAKKHFWPGRFDRRIVNSVPVVFDAAHNSNGVTYFLKKAHLSCSHIPKPWTLVYASLADKDWKDSIVLLNQHFDAIVFTQTQSSRSVEADLLMSHACSIGVSCSLSSHNTVAKALESGLEHSRATNGTLFVLGSITLIGESFEHWEIPVLSNQE